MENKDLNLIKSAIAGTCAGVSATLVGHPLDVIKTRTPVTTSRSLIIAQSYQPFWLQTSNAYKSAMDCARITARNEGIRGFYRGVTLPLLGLTPMYAIRFWGFDLAQKIMFSINPDRPKKLSLPEVVGCGAFAALAPTFITVPQERIKIALQTQDQVGGLKSVKRYTSMFDAISHIVKTEGVIRGLYKGTIPCLCRDIPGAMGYFGTNEFVLRALNAPGHPPSVSSILIAGGCAGLAFWSIGIPADVVKSRIQAAPDGTYKGTIDAYRKVLAENGVRSLYKGLKPALLRAFPANGAAFGGRAGALALLNYVWQTNR
ncbi:hypothetical protein SmJEL517_g02264 [Synchytrium microbalum]|uniref:Uncharacterized protein n=1 Tax=Synchytrium microbalum TaxID=1806994 RepID=A0A507CBG6_9FUNG|nr:uncharacterized protein SmJEL517_g02264 [Synchytrium microbalum]TPX35346.1 hypothetical protein SmJEL517_g02264 [Synchytrium microbalum]